MGILRGADGYTGVDGVRAGLAQRARALYDELHEIPVYRHHRECLRPWDRKLPLVVEQEAVRRSTWILYPPTTTWIFCVLLMCLVGEILVAVLPMFINIDRAMLTWRDLKKPHFVYIKLQLLLAVWIIMHLCSGFALWFIYLTEGFSKHQLCCFLFAVFVVLDCLWMDVFFGAQRLDWTTALWCVMLLATVVLQVALIRDKIYIAALFMLPQVAVSIAVLVYLFGFIKIMGTAFEWSTLEFRHFW